MSPSKRNTKSSAAPPSSPRLSSATQGEAFFISIVHEVIAQEFNGSIRAFAKRFNFSDAHYDKIKHAIGRHEKTGQWERLPRIRNTPGEGKLARAVEAAWNKLGQTFPKWSVFIEEVRKQYGSHRVSAQHVKDILRHAKVHTVAAKNVANAATPKHCKKRVTDATGILQFMRSKKIKYRSKSVFYFLDECSLNQLIMEKNCFLSPRGVTVYKDEHYSIRTESLSLLLIVDTNMEVVKWLLRRNKSLSESQKAKGEKKGTTWKVITDFLYEAIDEVGGKSANIYMDNVACHKKAFGPTLDDNSYGEKKKAMLKFWKNIQAPACTPESNLVEYFFADLKNVLKTKLDTVTNTMSGKQWFEFVYKVVKEWAPSANVSPDTLGHIENYLHALIAAGGNLQKEAIRSAGFANDQDLFDSIQF